MDPAVNRATWRWVAAIGLGSALAVAGYDLLTGWQVPGSVNAGLVFLGLAIFGVATWIAVLVANGRERRRILAGGGPFLTVLGLAARGARWSSLFAIGVTVLLFANCSATVTAGTTASGPTADPWRFWQATALEMLPLVLALALPAGLATASLLLARKGILKRAALAASLSMWSVAVIVIVAVVTTGIAIIGVVSHCFFGPSSGACAAATGGLMNPAAIGSLFLILPYLGMMDRILSARTSTGGE
jgi:hypothetical protein